MLGAKDFARQRRHGPRDKGHNCAELNLFLAQTHTDKLDASAAAQEQRANAQRRAAAPKKMSGRAHVNDKALK